MIKTFFLSRLLLTIGAAVLTAQAAAGGSPSPRRVACVGDSITAGYLLADPAQDAYPAQLARLLGAGWEVRNFGESGACVIDQGGYPYSKRLLHRQALEWKPDVVVIALGTNDAKPENIGAHPKAFVASYRALIARFRAANPGARIFLCVPPPVFSENTTIRGEIVRREIDPQVLEVARIEALPVIRLDEALHRAADRFSDTIHPDKIGAGMIAQTVYGELLFALTPPAKSLALDVNTAVVPVPRIETDSYNWWTRHAEELALHASSDPDLVLIGDSITHFWAGLPAANRVNGARAWEQAFGGRKVVNLGFGWDRTQNVLWRLDHGEFEGYHPKLVILNIGTNNLTGTENARVNTPAETAEGVLAICARLRALSPSTHILVMGVFPRGYKAGDSLRAPIQKLNTLLAGRLAGAKNVTFLDIGQRFLNADGSLPPELMPDGTHPSEKGYAIWVKALVESGLLP